MSGRGVRVVLGSGPPSPWADDSIPVPPPATADLRRRGRTADRRPQPDPAADAAGVDRRRARPDEDGPPAGDAHGVEDAPDIEDGPHDAGRAEIHRPADDGSVEAGRRRHRSREFGRRDGPHDAGIPDGEQPHDPREGGATVTDGPVRTRRRPGAALAALAAVMALVGTAIVVAGDDRVPGADTGRGVDVDGPAGADLDGSDGPDADAATDDDADASTDADDHADTDDDAMIDEAVADADEQPATADAGVVGPGIATDAVGGGPGPSVTLPPLRTGLSIAALAVDGSLVVVDLDRGSSRGLGGRRVDTTRPAYVVADREHVSVIAHQGPDGYRVRLDGDGDAPRAAPPVEGPLYPGPTPGTAWRRATPVGGAVDHVLVDGRGTALGPRIELEFGDVLGGDGRGGLLVRTVERVIVAADAGAFEFVTNGSLVAAGAGAFWVRECAVDGCVAVRIDRRTGERTAIELGDDVGARATGLVGVSRGPVGPTGQTVSPDGDVALVRRSPVSTDWLMVDLAGGRATEVPVPAPGAPVVWTADSRYAVWLSAGTIHVFDRDVGGSTEVPVGAALRTFARLDPAATTTDRGERPRPAPAGSSLPRAGALGWRRVTPTGRRARSAVPSGRVGPRGPSSTGS